MPRQHKRTSSSTKSGPSIGTVGATTALERLPLRDIPNGMIKLVSGRVVESFGFADPYFPNVPGIWSSVSESFVINGINGAGLIPGEGTLTNFVSDLYNQLLVRAISLGWNTANMTLETPGAFPNYLSAYGSVYSTLRGLQALTQINGINNACDLIASNIWQLRDEIEALIGRVEGYPMVPAFKAAIDAMSNVYIPSTSGLAPYFHFVDPGSQTSPANWVPTDFASVQAVQAMLLNLANNINGLQAVNASSADTIRITRLLSFLYGTTRAFGSKELNTSEMWYYMHMSKAWAFVNTTTGNGEVSPYFDPTVIPDNRLFVWGNPDSVDPLWFTYFRPTLFFSNSGVPVATIGSRGAFTAPLTTANGTMVQTYTSQDGAFSMYVGAGTGVPALSLNDGADEFPFARPAELQIPTSAQLQDARPLPGWERYYFSYAAHVDETLKTYQKWFLNGITATHR